VQAQFARVLAALCAAILLARPAAAFGPDATAADASFRFVVLCDVHLTVADLAGSRAQLRRAVDEINSFATHIDFVLVAGDLAQSSVAADLALELQAAKDELARLAVPYHVALGDHDITSTGDDAAFRSLFGPATYRFAHRGVQFVDLRTATTPDAATISTTALDSLSRWLGEISPSAPLIVYAHHPLGPVTPYGVTNRQAFYDLVDAYNLRAVFSGHYHGLFEEQRHGAWYCTTRALSLHRTNHDGDETKGYRLATVWPDFTVSSSFYALGAPPTFAPAPPVFAATGSRYAVVGRELRLALAARDESGETLQYAAPNLPSGATFDPQQVLFQWTPGAAQAGWHPGVRFLATNSTGTDTLDLGVRVLPTACVYDDFSAGFSNWSTAGGMWTVQNGALLQSTSSSGPYVCTAPDSYGDVYVEADIAMDQGVGYAGLVFRYQDPGNYYYLWNDGAQIELRRRVGGVASRLGDPVAVGAVSGWHHVRIEARGTNLKAYWDGTLRFEVTNATFASGSVGFVCSQAAARFDNFVAAGCGALPGRAPVLAAVGDRTAFVGVPCTLDLHAEDADGDAVRYSSTRLPAGATLDATSGHFTWTPPAGAAWTMPRCTFRAADGQLDDAETITFTVLDTTQACAYAGFDSPAAAANWIAAGGTWTVSAGTYTGTTTTSAWSRLGSSSYRDYTVQARIRVEGDGAGNLVFRAVDATHYYYLYASTTSGTLEIRKQQGTTSKTLASGGDIAGAVKNRWHTYAVHVTGNTIQVWADGEPRFQVIDASSPYLNGAVGLRVDGTTLRADDVVVSACVGPSTDAPAPAARAPLLVHCAPNPFNPSTSIDLDLGSAGPTEVVIYSAGGRCVRTLLDGALDAGAHRIVWDGRDDAGARVASGLYYLRVNAGEQAATAKLVLVR
jgi:hypothetical protein